ncbi:MAG: ABC transporter ATP-binding protein [Desulfohalobiaceae bacterium]|nr:ABC transporter ATP-binding protein [Desulfohalobiaceae bacterium]
MTAGCTLEAEGLKKTYPGCSEPALDQCSLTVQEEELFGLLGPNGAGKTTVISLLSTLLEPDSGRVSICGIDAGIRPDKVRNIIGLVPQDIALYANLTARENLHYFGRIYGLKRRELKRRVEECLAWVGLEERADQRVVTYSGGMKRRINLAIGLLHNPKFLLLDEPTVGIDAQSRNLILERLASLPQKGTTILYTTHYMEEAEKLCTRVAIIDRGHIVAQGIPRELMSQSGVFSLGELFLHMTGKHLRD